jgi:predicted transcriptional regulator
MTKELRSHRAALGISQSKLARISNVSRFKICMSELGSCSLSSEEQQRVREALQGEAERLRRTAAQIADDFSAKPAELG